MEALGRPGPGQGVGARARSRPDSKGFVQEEG